MKNYPEKIEWLKFSAIEWANDNSGIFYNRFDKPKSIKETKQSDKAGTENDKLEFNKLYYHKLGTSQDQDVLLYEE
jgi:prolyl oligopeptidase